MYIFIYYFLIVFKNKTLNTSFWRVENVEYVNQSASISIKNVSILDLPVGVFTPQSLIYFGFVIYEVAIWLICHLIRIDCYNPGSINDLMLMHHWKSISWLFYWCPRSDSEHHLYAGLMYPTNQGAWLLYSLLEFLIPRLQYRKKVAGSILYHIKRLDNSYYCIHKVVAVFTFRFFFFYHKWKKYFYNDRW